MWNPFRPVKVTDKIYNKFIDTGKVPKRIIRLIALKLIEETELNWYELTIFYGKTAEINETIREISKNKK